MDTQNALPSHESPRTTHARLILQHALELAIRQLDSGCREVFVLKELKGLSSTRAAEVLGISVGEVRRRLRQAHSQLNVCMWQQFQPGSSVDRPIVGRPIAGLQSSDTESRQFSPAA